MDEIGRGIERLLLFEVELREVDPFPESAKSQPCLVGEVSGQQARWHP
jgi:hypothetical protein